jgi:hypothetical protein
MTRTIEMITKEVRVSIVKWGENDYSVQTQFNMFPTMNADWSDSKYIEVLDEAELSSSMQVYGYLQEQRENHL